MPDPSKLNLILSSNPQDLAKVRLPGVNKPFEQMTIGELANFRMPADAQDSWDVHVETTSIGVSSSKHLAELGQIRAQAEMRRELALTKIRTTPIR